MSVVIRETAVRIDVRVVVASREQRNLKLALSGWEDADRSFRIGL